ncbi:hypothetical protein [Conchiformibius kuhniae]|uniref:Uncharacterized protein n=1 Tax=Conchiformibius kuhniae TaxID=211502 RepID=A0A8T9MT00_9NEIS|nr:hypothetical protein [Conchiformibius kuhniae]UOP05000.1 hypothetical protein LVJ77_01350 [Conchiformibius kuhniae]
MSMRETILKIIGKEGFGAENALWNNAELHKDVPKHHQRLSRHAELYAQYRREHIEAVRRGDYAEYGVTEADIVE